VEGGQRGSPAARAAFDFIENFMRTFLYAECLIVTCEHCKETRVCAPESKPMLDLDLQGTSNTKQSIISCVSEALSVFTSKRTSEDYRCTNENCSASRKEALTGEGKGAHTGGGTEAQTGGGKEGITGEGNEAHTGGGKEGKTGERMQMQTQLLSIGSHLLLRPKRFEQEVVRDANGTVVGVVNSRINNKIVVEQELDFSEHMLSTEMLENTIYNLEAGEMEAKERRAEAKKKNAEEKERKTNALGGLDVAARTKCAAELAKLEKSEQEAVTQDATRRKEKSRTLNVMRCEIEVRKKGGKDVHKLKLKSVVMQRVRRASAPRYICMYFVLFPLSSSVCFLFLQAFFFFFSQIHIQQHSPFKFSFDYNSFLLHTCRHLRQFSPSARCFFVRQLTLLPPLSLSMFFLSICICVVSIPAFFLFFFHRAT
jgi:hypothetical protein